MNDAPETDARRGFALKLLLGVGALALPAALILYLQATSGGLRVPVVGAGAIARVSEADSPDGVRYDLDVVPREPVSATHERVTAAVGGWPDVIVLGLDANALVGGDDAESEARAVLLRVTQQAENATAVPVVLGFVAPDDASPELVDAVARANAWWRTDVCRQPGALRICVEVERPAEVPAAIEAAVRDAVHRHAELEASTQVGR